MSDAQGNVQKDRFRVTLIKLARSTLFLLLVLISVVLFTLGFVYEQKPLWSNTLIGIGASLLAACVFSLFYTWIVEKNVKEILNAELEERLSAHEEHSERRQEETALAIERAMRNVATDISHSHYDSILRALPQFVPIKVYPAAISSNPDYLMHLIANIRHSSEYVFRGVTGRHLPALLMRSRPITGACQSIILDPRESDLIALYVRERFALQPQNRSAYEAKISEVRDEIFMSIVALFDISRFITVTVRLHRGPVYMRSEIFDQEAFLSVYGGNQSTPFPATHVFHRDSYFYTVLRKDVQECESQRMPHITLNASTTEAELNNFLSSINGDSREVDNWRQRSYQFGSEIEKVIDSGGQHSTLATPENR